MSSISSDEIISILKEEIENYEEVCKDQEVGTVISVGDGIATIYGIDHAMYGEIVTFENGLKGMVQDVRQNSIGCILFGSDEGVREGTKVARTQRKAGIPVHLERSTKAKIRGEDRRKIINSIANYHFAEITRRGF